MPLFFWIAAYIRPYRSRLAFLALLSVLEVGLAASEVYRRMWERFCAS